VRHAEVIDSGPAWVICAQLQVVDLLTVWSAINVRRLSSSSPCSRPSPGFGRLARPPDCSIARRSICLLLLLFWERLWRQRCAEIAGRPARTAVEWRYLYAPSLPAIALELVPTAATFRPILLNYLSIALTASAVTSCICEVRRVRRFHY